MKFIFLNHFSSGFSISIMKTDQAILRLLDAPTRAPAWPVGVDGLYYFLLLLLPFVFVFLIPFA